MEITLKQAEQATLQARAKAEQLKVPVDIVVLDTGGHIKSIIRMDDAFIGSIDIAIQKAKTSMLFGMDSEIFGEYLKPENSAYGLENTNGGLLGFPGGKPIRSDERILGYIGVSGGTVSQDQMIATAGSRI